MMLYFIYFLVSYIEPTLLSVLMPVELAQNDVLNKNYNTTAVQNNKVQGSLFVPYVFLRF